MSLQSTGYLINSNESGGWLDGLSDWVGSTAERIGDAYVGRWISENLPEAIQPLNPDDPIDNVSAEAGAVQQGFMDNPDNKKLLMYAAAGIALLLLLK